MIYFIKNTVVQAIKIGYSAKPARRLAGLQTASPHRLVLLGTIPGSEADEQAMHARFAMHRLEGEWFCGDIIDEVFAILAAPREPVRVVSKQIRNDANDIAIILEGVTVEANDTQTGIVDETTGVRAVCRIPGLRVKSFALTLTERPDGDSLELAPPREKSSRGKVPLNMLCGVELKYVLEFEVDFPSDPSDANNPLHELKRLASEPTPKYRHVFFDAENAVIPFGPNQNEYHVVGGSDSVLGEKGLAFRVLVRFERLLDLRESASKIKGVFTGQNYPRLIPSRS